MLSRNTNAIKVKIKKMRLVLVLDFPWLFGVKTSIFMDF